MNMLQRIYAAVTNAAPPLPKLDVEIAYANINGLLFGKKDVPFAVYNPSELLTKKGFVTVDKMRRDAQVKIALAFKKHAILGTGWCIESPEGQEEDWEPTEFVTRQLNGLPGTFEKRLRNILSAIDYGFSLTELIWTKTPDNKIGLKNLKTRKPHDITFDVNPHGDVASILQMNRPLPVEKFILYSFMDEFDNPYGVSELEAAYDPWWLKNNAYKFLAIMLERLGIPPIFASFNAQSFSSTESRTALQSIITNMQTGTAATIPRGSSKDDLEFWAPEIAGQATSVFVPALQHADNDIAKAILLPGLLGGTSDQEEGSFARANVHFDMFMLVISALRKEIEESVVQEQVIKPLVDFNFATDGVYPQFRFRPLEKKDIGNLFDTWTKLLEKNAVSQQPGDEAFIRDQLEMPPITDETVAASNIDDEDPQGEDPQGEDPQGEDPQGEYAQKSKAINYAQIKSDFDDTEQLAIEGLRDAYKNIKAATIKFIQSKYDLGPKMVDQIDLRGKQGVQDVLSELMRVSFGLAEEHLRSELPRKYAVKKRPVSGFRPKEAIQYLNQKSIQAAVTANDKLLNAVKQELLTALRGQKTVGEVTDAVNTIFEPYIGDEPAYAETVVRTNMIDAYNQGRLTAMRDPEIEDFMAAVEYSSVMDNRTTPLCEHLNGKIFKINDPDLDRLTPPNHFNCRAVLVPVLIDERPDSDEFITAVEKAEALEMAGSFA